MKPRVDALAQDDELLSFTTLRGHGGTVGRLCSHRFAPGPVCRILIGIVVRRPANGHTFYQILARKPKKTASTILMGARD